MQWRLWTVTACVGLALAGWLVGTEDLTAAPPAADKSAPAVDPADVERARREVRLLDDIYKTAIVLITKHYVEEESDLPAGEAFKVLFQSMKEKGWHEVRLIDGAGDPVNDDNKPADDFERRAIAAFLNGKDYVEEITTVNNRPALRAATPVPVVMEKCVMCHKNYQGKKLAGALGYTLELKAK
ncbi:MAG: DUF3365 domain-containing protein [Planctomycetes bacterium]|nr:DUF3365 domain-containing protein [Planctomycetota bacterium]